MLLCTPDFPSPVNSVLPDRRWFPTQQRFFLVFIHPQAPYRTRISLYPLQGPAGIVPCMQTLFICIPEGFLNPEDTTTITHLLCCAFTLGLQSLEGHQFKVMYISDSFQHQTFKSKPLYELKPKLTKNIQSSKSTCTSYHGRLPQISTESRTEKLQ